MPSCIWEESWNTQMIFQDPYSSLDPRMTILDIVAEPLRSSKFSHGKELEDRIKKLMTLVGMEVKRLKRYPHAFSGGQRQRIGIARALAPNPKLIVADEPEWEEVTPEHFASCHFAKELSLKGVE